MEIKIEKTPKKMNGKGDREAFMEALKALKVGESFVVPLLPNGSYARQAISAAQFFLGVRFQTRTEGKNTRVARIV